MRIAPAKILLASTLGILLYSTPAFATVGYIECTPEPDGSVMCWGNSWDSNDTIAIYDEGPNNPAQCGQGQYSYIVTTCYSDGGGYITDCDDAGENGAVAVQTYWGSENGAEHNFYGTDDSCANSGLDAFAPYVIPYVECAIENGSIHCSGDGFFNANALAYVYTCADGSAADPPCARGGWPDITNTYALTGNAFDETHEPADETGTWETGFYWIQVDGENYGSAISPEIQYVAGNGDDSTLILNDPINWSDVIAIGGWLLAFVFFAIPVFIRLI